MLELLLISAGNRNELEFCGEQSWFYPVVRQYFREISISLNSESQDISLIAHKQSQLWVGVISQGTELHFPRLDSSTIKSKIIAYFGSFSGIPTEFPVVVCWPGVTVQGRMQQRGVQGFSCAVHTLSLHVPTARYAWHLHGCFI